MRTTNTMQGMVNILLKVSMLVTIVAVLSCNHAEEGKPVDAAVASTAKDGTWFWAELVYVEPCIA